MHRIFSPEHEDELLRKNEDISFFLSNNYVRAYISFDIIQL